MDLKAVSARLNIDVDVLKKLEKEELLTLIDLTTSRQESIEQLSLLLSLKKIGLDEKEMADYLRMSSESAKNGGRLTDILRNYRKLTLRKLHEEQEKISTIDYMLYELKKSES